MAERQNVHLPDPRPDSGVRIVRHDRARPHGDGLAPSADAGPEARPSGVTRS